MSLRDYLWKKFKKNKPELQDLMDKIKEYL
jgi:hypothetical protein